ncbi:MAG TPA: carboxypeptidase regulatory-like domain-containing protein [Blastocatellia bacterium]|nr:carboxypeptidase regulatory-like domain-containing protein [Blastocatellia bacterium]
MKQAKSTGTLRSILSVLFCTLLLSLGSLVFAQENTGAIQGTVKDATGASIPGAKVTASSPALVRPLDTTSDSTGVYRFPKLPVGIYTVTASQSGFKTIKNEDIAVQLGDEIRLDIALTAGNVTESVTISASSEAIDVTSSKSATSISERFIDTTPKGRTFNSLLQVAPGVVFDSRAGSIGGGVSGTSGNNPGGGVGGYSVNGSSGSENAFIIDGVEVSNIRNAALGRESAIPFEFVREIQVKSGGFEAEYGGATGGVVNVVTKSGSDQFHGEGALMFTNAGLNSRPRGFWQRSPSSATTAEFFRQKEDEYRTFYPGFSFGGPILKERLHFFASYFPEVNRTERSINFVSGGNKTTTNRLIRHFGITRLDYAPTQKIQVNTSFLWTPIRNAGLLTGTDGRVAPPTNDLSIGGGYTPAKAYTASFNYTPTSKLILSARYGYKYLNDKGNTYGLPSGVLILYQQPTSGASYVGPAVPASVAGPAGFQNISNPFQVIKDVTTRHNVYLDGSYVARLFGQQHTFKAGYALNRIANEVIDDYPNGRFDFYWGSAFTRGTINSRGTYGYYIWEDGVRHNNGANSRNQGVYFQDQWQVTRRITVNAGLRIENEFLPPFTKTASNGAKIGNPISFGWGDKVAPRFGGAWDVLGNGKWKVSASYGVFFDTMKYELARSSFGGDYWHERVYKLDGTDLSQVSKAKPDALGALIIDIDNRTQAVDAQGNLEGIDPSIKATRSREFTVASEHQFRTNMVFSARYTRKRLGYAIEDVGTLDASESEVYIISNPGYGIQNDKVNTLNGNTINLKSGQSLFPKAVRNYDGLEIRFDQRFSEGILRNLTYQASYTYSRIWGNYAGLANSDEAGRSQPNVSRAFDQPYGNFDSKGNNVYGLLATDRPHIFKLFGNYDYKWKAGTTSLSLSQLAYSGTPLTTEVVVFVPVFINGRGDLGRTPTFTQTDLLLAHTFSLSERVKLKLDANITNLFNQGIVTGRTVRLNRNGQITVGPPGSGAKVTDQQFFTGFDALSFINPVTGASPAQNVIYNLPSAYQGIREIRVGMHLTF